MLCRAQLRWEVFPELPRAAEVAKGSLSRVNNNVGWQLQPQSDILTSLGGVLGRGLEVGTGQETKDREESFRYSLL